MLSLALLLLVPGAHGQDKVNLSITGDIGSGASIGYELEVPAGPFGFLSEGSQNNLHGWDALETGTWWFSDHVGVGGGAEFSPGFSAGLAEIAIAGKRWDTFVSYYPKSRGATIFQEFQVKPRWWLGAYGGYEHGRTLSLTIRYELRHKK